MKRTLTIVSAEVRLPSSTRMPAERLSDTAREDLGRCGSQVDIDVIKATMRITWSTI
ncbi:hypothetical protein [Streptomyces sp. NPDC002346]